MTKTTLKDHPMAKVYTVEPELGISKLLIGAHSIDAPRVSGAPVGLGAADAARLMLAQPPTWIAGLLAIRNALVTPFGLKTGPGAEDHLEKIEIFQSSRLSEKLAIGAVMVLYPGGRGLWRPPQERLPVKPAGPFARWPSSKGASPGDMRGQRRAETAARNGGAPPPLRKS